MTAPRGASPRVRGDPDPGGALPGACADQRRAGVVVSASWFWCAMAVAIGVALAFRFAGLDARPMHHDEANQAIRFGQLLETGEYRYHADEHHGPTLYYLTLPVAWLRGQHTTASLDEWTVRAVPALFGVGTILLLIALARGIGRPAAAIAAGLLAVAPPLTYYSRFYIQESLLLFFTFGFLVTAGRYARSLQSRDALWAGAFAGFALATKETAVILLPAAMAGCLVARRWSGVAAGRQGAATRGGVAAGLQAPRSAGHIWAAAAVALAVAGLFYSSFFTNMGGLAEPFRAAGVYFSRGVNPQAHREPWYYYLRLLAGTPGGSGAALDLGLAVLVIAGIRAAFRSETDGGAFWARCLLVHAATATLVYSALPYKTPWNVLPFYASWIVLGAIGAAEPFDRSRSRKTGIVLASAMIALCATLGLQSWRVNFRYPADPRNPYAYVHTSPDILRLARRVTALSALHQDREKMLVAVVAAPSEQWPLPWYLRRMARVGYWTSAAAAGEAIERAPVVIASSDNADAVQAAIGARSQSEYYGLRPHVLLSVFIERSLWDRFLESVK
jgi:uncharacterized protein (TIGR03663 family)